MNRIRFHWGHAMILAMLSFITFILVLFFQVDHIQTVKKDYYVPDEIVGRYIESQKRYNTLPDEIKPRIIKQENGLLIEFPNNWKQAQVEGEIELMRPSELAYDIVKPIVLDRNNSMLIHKNELVKGYYQLTLDFGKLSDNEYLYRLKIDSFKW